MKGSAAIVASLLAAGTVLAGCNGPHPFVDHGDANSVEVRYAGDPASALPLARDHCKEYDRVPQLVQLTTDGALYNCVSPPHAP